MTSAQKTAKEKFKKAIEYRKKTGVSLKEAFAHIYGKKIGAVKKKAVVKKIGATDNKFYSSFKIKGFEFIVDKITTNLGNVYFTISSPSVGEITKVSSDMTIEIVKKRALDVNRFIYNSVNLTQAEANQIRKTLNKYFESLLKQVKVLNKSVKKLAIKKPVAKKVAVKKPVAKKVARQTRSPRKVRATYKVDYQTGKANRTDRGNNQDAKRKALPPGKRVSNTGNTYYETRANRTDLNRKAMTGIGSNLSKAQEIKNLSTLGVGALMKKVITILKSKAKDYNNLQDLFNDILNNGLQSGIISELIYYKDTLAFYKKYQDEIVGLLKEAMFSSGIDSPEGLFGSKWDRTDPFAQGTNNKNLLTWFAFEETTRTLDNILH